MVRSMPVRRAYLSCFIMHYFCPDIMHFHLPCTVVLILLIEPVFGTWDSNTRADVRGLKRSGTNLLQSLLYSCDLKSNCTDTLPNGDQSFFKSIEQSRGKPCWKHLRVHSTQGTISGMRKPFPMQLNKIHDLDKMTNHDSDVTYAVAVKNVFAWVLSIAKYEGSPLITL